MPAPANIPTFLARKSHCPRNSRLLLTSCLVSQGNPRMRLASAQPLHKPPASLASDRIPPGPALWAAASTGTWLLLSPFASFKSIASAPTCTAPRSEEHTSELQSRVDLVCRLLLE